MFDGIPKIQKSQKIASMTIKSDPGTNLICTNRTGAPKTVLGKENNLNGDIYSRFMKRVREK